MKRKTVIVDETSALDTITDGMTIALGGFITTQHATGLIRGIARRKVKNLTVIGSVSSSLEVDLLISCGCVERLITAYVGAESTAPMGPFFKKSAEEETIQVWECDEIIVMAMLQATMAGIPFYPVRGGLGTDLPELNPDLVPFKDPIKGENLLAVPAMKIDVALTHASIGDCYGNVQYDGNPYADEMIHRASARTITSVEKMVPPEFIRRDPFKTVYTADMVVRMPFGSHPFSCQGAYVEDTAHLDEYVAAAYMATRGNEEGWKKYRSRFIDGPEDHMAYLEQVGVRSLLSLHEY